MALEADRVDVILEAETADYEAKISGATRVFVKEMDQIKAAAGNAERATSVSFGRIAAGVGGAALAITSALAAGVSAFINYVDGLDKAAGALGITTDRLQELRYAADASGVSSDVLARGMKSLNDKLKEASLGAEKPIKMFRVLGVEIRDAQGRIKNVGDIFPKFADRINAIVDPVQRAAVAQQFLGDSASEMAPLLERGSAGINELANAANRLGIVLSAETIKRTKEAADRFEDVRRVLSVELMSVVSQNSDAIITLANAFATLATNIGGAIQQLGILSNMSGFRAGDRGSIDKLLSTKSGRDAMLNDIDARIRQNQEDRASNRGGRRGWNGVFEWTGSATQGDRDRLDREFKALVRQRNAVLSVEQRGGTSRPAPVGTPPNVGGLLAPKGRAGPSAETLARRAEAERRRQIRDDVRFANEQDAVRLDILAAQTEILGTEEDRATLARARVAAQRSIDERSLQLDFERSDVEKQALAALYREREAVELRAIEEEKRLRDLSRATDVQINAIRREAELLGVQEQLARTSGERREIELKLLDLQYREAEQRLKLLAASKDAVTAAEARKDLDALNARKSAERELINRRNQGPMASYLDSIPRTAAEINEALEGIAVNGLRDVEDGFARAATKALGLKGALGGVVEQLIKMVFQQQIFNALSGGGGGILGGIGKVFGLASGAAGGAGLSGFGKSAANLPKFARGGIIPVGGYGGVDQNVLSINGRPRAMVSAGEHLAVIPSNMGIMPQRSNTTVNQYFTLDARQGITTPELLQHVNEIAARASTAAGMASVGESQRQIMKRGRRRIPG